MGFHRHAPGHFTPRKQIRYPLYGRLAGTQGRSGWMQNILPPLDFDPRTVQRVAIRFTDWAIPAHTRSCTYGKMNSKGCGHSRQIAQIVQFKIQFTLTIWSSGLGSEVILSPARLWHQNTRCHGAEHQNMKHNILFSLWINPLVLEMDI